MTANKILVHIRQPSSDMAFDAYVPCDIRANLVVRALGELFSTLSDGLFLAAEDTMLWSDLLDGFVDIGKSLAENGLNNGDTLLLV